MKRHNSPASNRSATTSTLAPGGKKGTVPICRNGPEGASHKWGLSPFSHARAFTLVELLVVISIIGILAGLITAAAIMARIAARNAAITMELKNLEMACQAYKNKFGEYPPDFAGASLPVGDPMGDAAHAAILRHIRKAFPRCTTISIWNDFLAQTGLNLSDLTPQTALAFWLGGARDATGRPIGFSANPANPFDATSTSRIKPFFDFDLNRLGGPIASNNFRYRYWPQGAVGDMTTSAGAIAYFRAENGRYTVGGQPALQDLTNVKKVNGVIWPAVDSQWSSPAPYPPIPVFVWINPMSFQIFSSGLDMTYSAPNLLGPLAYPDGTNYDPVGHTFDDITNFSGGTLEDAQ